MAKSAAGNTVELLGADADDLLGHKCKTIDSSLIYAPGPDFIDRVFSDTDRAVPYSEIFNPFSAAGGWPARVTYPSFR